MKHLSDSRKIYAFASLILGVLLLIWPGNALRMVAFAAGIVVMAGGITSILTYIRNRRRPAGMTRGISLVIGVVVTLVGAWIFMNPEKFATIIPSAVGYLIVLSGIVKLLETFSLTRVHYRKWWASLLTAIATIFMGLLLINHAFGVALTMIRLGGIFLLFSGISDLWVSRRVDEYVRYGRRNGNSGNRRAQGAGGGTAGSATFDTSDPDIIDAEDYREM